MIIAHGNASDVGAPPDLEDIVLSQAEAWLKQCDTYRQWYLQTFVRHYANGDQEQLANRIHPWMIRISRALVTQMLDPEFPHRHLAQKLEATLWQLEEDWAMRHNSMSHAQAESILRSVFTQDAS